jgi:hypothetical protein
MYGVQFHCLPYVNLTPFFRGIRRLNAEQKVGSFS